VVVLVAVEEEEEEEEELAEQARARAAVASTFVWNTPVHEQLTRLAVSVSEPLAANEENGLPVPDSEQREVQFDLITDLY
jgi:hypothetical protein